MTTLFLSKASSANDDLTVQFHRPWRKSSDALRDQMTAAIEASRLANHLADTLPDIVWSQLLRYMLTLAASRHGYPLPDERLPNPVLDEVEYIATPDQT